MLKIDANKEKQLTFEVQIGGVTDFDKVESFFRIITEDVEYGFPCRVTSDSIQVSLPPLNKVTAKRFREGDEVEIKLEVVVDGHYLIPWRDRAKLSNPLVIEAKIKDDDFVKNPQFETKLVSDEGGQKQVTIVKEQDKDISDDFVDKVALKLKELMNQPKMQEQEVGPGPIEDEAGEEDSEEEEKDETKKEQEEKPITTKDVERLLSETIEKLNLTGSRTTKKKKAVPTLNEFKQNLTKEDIYKYMHKAGTKNPKIQNIVYEQASSLAPTSKPIDILKQVIKVMKKKK